LIDLEIDWINADSGRLTQVLVNLITNAIKFTKDEKEAKNIDVCIGASLSSHHPVFADLTMVGKSPSERYANDESPLNVYLWCSVTDTGCGMDSEGRARIFPRFGQASPKTYSKYGGSGLGLVVSRKLVDLQNGQIGFVSREGVGSTFAFSARVSRSLPVESKLHMEPIKETRDVAPRPMVLLPHDAEQHIRLNILLVEDNLVNQKVLKKQLQRQGHFVHTADNGQEAISFLKTTVHWIVCETAPEVQPAIDLVLMDIEMPVMDGLECARLIRAAELNGSINKHFYIVAVTANARPEQLKLALSAGMDNAIAKPFRITSLEPIFKSIAIA
jgi:CheY-like chemotaxis protein